MPSTVVQAKPTVEPTTFEAYGTTWVKPTLPSCRAENGYSIRDGPWRCQIIAGAEGVKEGDVYLVRDEESFKSLFDKLNVLNKKYPKKEHAVMIMHVSPQVSRTVRLDCFHFEAHPSCTKSYFLRAGADHRN